jgi:hypothetical protein|tara:strand:- start:124 stop:453 length:330 start_codon:yes stop_codon:yes gene_type:complete
MTYVFDIDGTLCTNTDGDYLKAEPLYDRIELVNVLAKRNKIVLYTARGMGRHKNNAQKAIEEFYELTKKQLEDWGVQYDQLFLGKPAGDYYIDDKGIKDDAFFENELCP